MIREGKADGWLHLPIHALQPWAAVNNVSFDGVTVGPQPGLEDRGSTVIAQRELQADEHGPAVMTVPRDLILSLDQVREHAKYDRDLRDILDLQGDFARTARGAILSFLLMQCSTACPSMPEKRGVQSAFTEYVKFLPLELLPTFWKDEERALLTGTTLEPALIAKTNSLYREFENFRTATSKLAWCATHWWDEVDGLVTFDDWLQVDAMYRSRALEFPGIGDCMATCIDMANHVSGEGTVAIYEVNTDGDAVLMLRDGKTVAKGAEVNITYGDAKGACEMLFSYGFIEGSMASARELFLDLPMPEDDPLSKAKATVADCAPGFKLYEADDGGIAWDGDYIWLICVNEEDGLDFAVQQTTDGQRELKALWRDAELPALADFTTLLSQDEMWDVLQLRAVSILQDRVAIQLQALYGSEEDINSLAHGEETGLREGPWRLAMKLRALEADLLEKAYAYFEERKTELCQKDTVLKYLSGATSEPDEDDFS